MAVELMKLYRGAASTGTASALYTAPSGVKTTIASIVVYNSASTTVTVTLAIGGFNLYSQALPAGATVDWDSIRQVMHPGETFTALASATGVIVHASGSEVS